MIREDQSMTYRTIQYRKNRNHRGSSLITVLVVITVLMVIVLSVLAVSYQYFMTQANDMYEQKCRESAYSLSQELKNEIIGKKYNQYQEQAESNNELWLYLRETIAQENNSSAENVWPYYDNSEEKKTLDGENYDYDINAWKKAASLEEAKRYFKLQPVNSGDDVLNGELPLTSVCMYWEPWKYTNSVSGIRLHVIVTSQMGDYTYTIRDVYHLETDTYAEPDANYLAVVSGSSNGTAQIFKYQRWEWVYDGEE